RGPKADVAWTSFRLLFEFFGIIDSQRVEVEDVSQHRLAVTHQAHTLFALLRVFIKQGCGYFSFITLAALQPKAAAVRLNESGHVMPPLQWASASFRVTDPLSVRYLLKTHVTRLLCCINSCIMPQL